MPLDTEREQRQQAELIRLADELARKTAIIAELKQQNKSLSRRLADQRAANIELHDVAEQWRAAGDRTASWALEMQAQLLRHINELERLVHMAHAANLALVLRPAKPAPHRCGGCGSEIAAEAVAWADGQTWACVECKQRG